jgi:outer membrane protein TolC
LDAEIELLDQLLIAARRKYETGRGLQQDILRAETARTRLEDRRAELKQAALTNGRRFAVLLGRNPDDVPDPPQELPETFPLPDRGRLFKQLVEQNPALKALRAEVEASRERVSFARRNWVPDLNLGVGYGFRQDSPSGMERPDFFTVSAGLTIPLFGSRKQGPAVSEAKAGVKETAERLRSTELNLRFLLEKFLDEDSRLDEQIRLFRQGVIPQAQATLDAAMAEYMVGKVDFEALLLAETALYNAQLDYWARVRDRLKTRAALATLTAEAAIIGSVEED